MTNYKPRYQYTALERETKENGERTYCTPNGTVPSVTTILSKTGDKSGLDAWRAFVGEKKAQQIKEEATGLGSLMHEHLEKHILGESRPGGTNLVRQMAKNMADVMIKQGLPILDEIIAVEAPLYYPSLYAGTTDLVAEVDGELVIADFKTATKMKSADQIGDYYCQLAAYGEAHNVLYGTNIQKGIVLMVSRDLKFEKFIISGSNWQKACDEWASRVEAYYSTVH